MFLKNKLKTMLHEDSVVGLIPALIALQQSLHELMTFCVRQIVPLQKPMLFGISFKLQ